jgi:hypothetical protein
VKEDGRTSAMKKVIMKENDLAKKVLNPALFTNTTMFAKY